MKCSDSRGEEVLVENSVKKSKCYRNITKIMLGNRLYHNGDHVYIPTLQPAVVPQ